MKFVLHINRFIYLLRIHTFRAGHGGRLAGLPRVVPDFVIGALQREHFAADIKHVN